jgi:acyl-CoA synthetase (AMP-forming)/AMP-acid ligase II
MPTHAIDIELPALDRTDCSSVSRGVVAGIDESHRLDARARLCARPYPMYGMSESPAHVTGSSSDDLENLRTTEGRPLPGTELRICDDDDRPLPAGTHGNILVRGPNRFLGYYRSEALNRTSLTPDGFFRTGDSRFVDDAGFLTFVSRSKDIIRRWGHDHAGRCRSCAATPPRISDVAVIACRIRASASGLRLRDHPGRKDMSLSEITDFLPARPSHATCGRSSLRRCGELPRTPSLKVRRTNCAADPGAR